MLYSSYNKFYTVSQKSTHMDVHTQSITKLNLTKLNHLTG